MAKRKQKRKTDRKIKSIGGWLILILAIFTYSWISAFWLLYLRLKLLVIQGYVPIGVIVTMTILTAYCFFLGYSIILILKKRKQAIKITTVSLIIGLVFSAWYSVVGKLIFYSTLGAKAILAAGLISFLMNFIIALAIILYLKNSKRVKNTFVR